MKLTKQQIERRKKFRESLAKQRALNEDLNSSYPVAPLPENSVFDFINNIPYPAQGVPPKFFRLGYFYELSNVAAEYRGGRGSEGKPFVRIFKATEYSAIFTGTDYERLGSTKRFRQETGKQRSDKPTGWSFSGPGTLPEKIAVNNKGEQALAARLTENCSRKTKYWISIDDGDLTEASREEVAKYLTATAAKNLLNPQSIATRSPKADAETGEIIIDPKTGKPEMQQDKPANTNWLKLHNIYMIGNLGNSIIR